MREPPTGAQHSSQPESLSRTRSFPFVASLLGRRPDRKRKGDELPEPLPLPPGRLSAFTWNLEVLPEASGLPEQVKRALGRADTTGEPWRKRGWLDGTVPGQQLRRRGTDDDDYFAGDAGALEAAPVGLLGRIRASAACGVQRVRSDWQRRREAKEQAQLAAREGDRHAYVCSRGAVDAYALSSGKQLQADTHKQVAAALAAHPCFVAQQCAPQPAAGRLLSLVTATVAFLLLWPRSFCAVCNAIVTVHPQAIGYTSDGPMGSVLFSNQLLDQHAALQVETGTSTQGAFPCVQPGSW